MGNSFRHNDDRHVNPRQVMISHNPDLHLTGPETRPCFGLTARALARHAVMP